TKYKAETADRAPKRLLPRSIGSACPSPAAIGCGWTFCISTSETPQYKEVCPSCFVRISYLSIPKKRNDAADTHFRTDPARRPIPDSARADRFDRLDGTRIAGFHGTLHRNRARPIDI